MKRVPPTLARRVSIPGALAVAATLVACPATPVGPTVPPCNSPQADGAYECIDDAGCTVDYAQRSCPAHGVCDYGANGDAEVIDACPQPSCVNVSATDGAALNVVCTGDAANPECRLQTAYYADGSVQNQGFC